MNYYIVEGWKHNTGGDDKYFIRGFVCSASLDKATTDLTKKCGRGCMGDIQVKQVNKIEWEKMFKA